MKNKRKIINNSLLMELFGSFLIKELLLTLLLPIFILFIFVLIHNLDFQWLYDISPFIYDLISTIFDLISDNLLSIIIFLFIVWLLCSLINVYNTLKKAFVYIDDIYKGILDLVDKNIEYIELPDDLALMQNKLNVLKKEAIDNEKLAKDSEQRKNDLIVYLAHDIKTPLTTIIGYLSLLEEAKDIPKLQQNKYISVILDKAYRLEELINELFDVARFNSETIILEKEEVNIGLMLEQLKEDFYPVLNECNKEIKLTIKDRITIYADSDKLARVFSNLIKNAINYSTDNEIVIEEYVEDNSLFIIFMNKGKQISKEKLDKIFEKFYRLDSARSSKNGGSGLGLAISKEIIELHGGTIEAESNEQVTKFFCKLPINLSKS